MKAKSVSLWVIILAGLWVGVLALVKAVFPAIAGVEFALGVPEIIATGVFFVIIFTPVYRSIWLDKQLGAKVEEAKISGAAMERLSAQLAAALEKSAEAKEAECTKEFLTEKHLHELSDKDKDEKPQPDAAEGSEEQDEEKKDSVGG